MTPFTRGLKARPIHVLARTAAHGLAVTKINAALAAEGISTPAQQPTEVPMPQKLDETQIQSALSTLPNWKLEQGELVQTATFPDFIEAMSFVNQVAKLAEAAGHHPDIDIRYNKVRLALVTHDAGGITQNDISLAQNIDQIGIKKHP